MNNQPIGIYDSGVGGLSILREIKKVLPLETFIYVADQKNVPYGGKTKQELIELSSNLVRFLISKKVKLVVVACNTSTVYAIDSLRKNFDIPIIGTVPVVKTIANISKTKKAAVFSTPATAKSKYLDKLVKKFADGVKVYKVGGTGLEELIEEGKIKSKEIEKILLKHLIPLKKKGVDAIALGCTHYPFLRDQIESIVGESVKVLDSGEAVALQTKKVLKNNHILANKRGEDYYYSTGDEKRFEEAINSLLGIEKRKVESIKLNNE